MAVAFDNTFLSLIFNPGTRPTPNPATGAPVSHCVERIEALIGDLEKRSQVIILPTPCLAKMLCIVPDFNNAINRVLESNVFRVAEFNFRSALNLALDTRIALDIGDKKGGSEESWQKVKFDRQIAATAKAFGASILYTDDTGQTEFARKIGLEVKHTWDLKLPPEHAQTSFL